MNVRLGLSVAALATLLALHAVPAVAQGCGTAAGPVAGTIANPQAPCHEPTRRPLQPQSGRDAPAQQGERGVFRHGNTTLRVGGSVSTDVTVRGR